MASIGFGFEAAPKIFTKLEPCGTWQFPCAAFWNGNVAISPLFAGMGNFYKILNWNLTLAAKIESKVEVAKASQKILRT